MAAGGAHLSKEFFELVKSIGESRSKQEEDKIIVAEVSTLKVKMAAKDVTPKKMKEYLMRMIYVEMLGHDASFGHIHAVQMANSRNILEKRMGYLAVTLVLNPDHQFMLLLINTMQKDMRSDNVLEVSMSLGVVCKLVSAETVPALLPLVVKLLDHKEGLVKKKAVMALHRFNALDPTSTAPLNSNIRKALCDSNISVMYASLHLLHDLAINRPAAYKDLIPDFVSILKQVIEHRLPREYDYHRMPAPWIQLKLLQILAVLGASDKAASEGMYEVLREVMKRADVGINVGYAIVYECVRTITSIYPDQSLIEDAALSISRFITSENHNLKYLGITALASIVQIDPKYAAEHQLVVIDSLEDPDETLKRKTLDLLYSMTNPQNVTVVVDKLIGFLNAATDNFMRIDLLSRISQLSEKYAPSNDWFVTAMNRTMELAGEQCKPEYANMVMKLIIDNASGQAGEEDIREFAVDTYLHLLATRKTLPDLLVQVSAWVIGEYGHTSRQSDAIGQLHALIAAMDRAGADQAITKGWIISAMLKIVARLGTVPPEVLDIVTRYQNSQQVDLQQRAHEFIELAKAPQLMRDVLPADQASAELDVDETLTFLDGYVNAALAAGAKAYQPRSEFGLSERKDDGGLKITAYAAAPTAQHTVHGGHGQPAAAANPYANQDPNAASFFGPGGGPHNGTAATSASGLAVKERKWGPSGFNDPHKAAHDAHPPQGGSPYGAGGPGAAAANFPGQQQQGFGGPHDQHGQHGQPDYGQPHQPVQGSFGRPQRAAPQISEKEKLASSLFAGVAAPSAGSAIGGGSRPTGSFGRPGAPSAGAPGQPRTGGAHQPGAPHVSHPPQQQQPPKQVDLLGGMFADGGQAAAKPPSQNDLVGLFGAGQQPPAGAGGPSGPPRSSGGPLDLLASSPPPAGGPAPGGFDLLGGGGGDSGAPASPTASAYGLSSASPAIQAQLAPLPKSSPMDVVAGSDARLQVSYIKAYGRESTTIGVFLSNKTQQPVPNITLSLSVPPGLSGNFTGEPTPQARPGAAPGTHNVVYTALAPSQTASLLINLSVRELTFLASATLAVNGQVQVPAGGAPLSFSVPLDLSDMLRPAEGMTTAQYGGFWKQYTDEAKGAIRPSSVTQPPEYMQRIGSVVRLFPVQTIGQECIAAGRLVSPLAQVGAANLMVFVHGKVAGGGVDVIARSKSAQLSQALVKQLQAALK